MGAKTIDDLLLSRYIGELSASYSINRQSEQSPYKLPLRHTNILASHRSLRGCHSSRSQNSNFGGKRDSERSKSSDPTSARQKRQQLSCDTGSGLGQATDSRKKREEFEDGSSLNEEPQRSHSQSRRRRTSIPTYLRIADAYVVIAFRNGDKSTSVRVAAPNFEKLLEQCTIRLGLPSSARKLFLITGQEVQRNATIQRGTEIYASMGESFKDPAKLLEKRLNLGADVQWTLNGISLPADRERESTKPASTPRGLTDTKGTRRRILIFANGKGRSGIEVVANLSNIEELMYNCTLKFNSGQHVKRLLLQNGQDVEKLDTDVPEVDPLLSDAVGAPILGPVWASKGENISPMGVEEYLRDVIRFVQRKKTLSDNYLTQLNLAYYSDDKDSLAKDSNLKDKRILSMSDDELSAEIEKENDKQDKYKAFLRKHRKLLKNLEPEAKAELEEGSKFTMKHISALPEKHSLVSGYPGLRVAVFMNGKDSDPVTAFFNVQEASRGLKKDNNRKLIIFQRFLDALSANPLLASQNGMSKGILVRRAFTKSGDEITDVMAIHQEQQIWISHGEDWVDPFTYCLQAEISKVIEWTKVDGSRFAVVRSDLPQMEESSAWRAQNDVPNGIEQRKLPADEPQEDEENEEPRPEQKPPEESVPSDSCFLQNTKKEQLCLFVEPVVGTQRMPKEAPGGNEGDEKVKHVLPVWPRAGVSQNWVVHKTGQISPKNFKLALTVSEDTIETKLQGAPMRGSIVKFCPFEEDEDRVPVAQRWNFNTDGLIYSEMRPDLVLTYLGGLLDEPHTHPKNELRESNQGYRNMLAVCEPMALRDDLDRKLRLQLEKYQRFGLRLSKFENFSTWRKAGEDSDQHKSENHKDPSWSKLALLWPTDKRGEWVSDLDWPLECYMLAFAPPLKTYKSESTQPKRFFCLKNGERNQQFGVCVTAPNMTNMKKKKKMKQGKKKQRHHNSDQQAEDDSINGDDYLHVPHCTDMTVQKVEFKIFLECCTSLLGLSSAARRIFDDKGVEHESLENLERDQVLYVSVGESWEDPKYTKAQLEARSLLVKLAEDVDKIRSFVALKRTAALVISAKGLSVGAKLGVSRDVLTKRERRAKQLKEAQSPPDATFDSSDDEDDDKIDPELGLTAHERACHRSDERHSNLKWPWERIVSNELDQDTEENSKQQIPAKAGAKTPHQSKDMRLRQFGFEDGFFFSKEDSSLVLTATDSGGSRVLDVTLQKRRPDNPYQRWQLGNNGFVALKYQSTNVLTVKLPKVTVFSAEPVDIESSILTVQPLKAHQFGRAHQLFVLDEERSTIRCFATNSLDIAVTAANHSGCCSYYVTTSGEPLDQPGYTAYLPVDRHAEAKMKACTVCVSCAKSLRGKYKLQKLVPGAKTDFACSFGRSDELKLKERGSFKLLNGKIDLTDGEDTATLKRWENEIETRRENLSVKAIASRLSEAKTPRPIRILAYRNGEGRLCKPVPIHGSSIQGIMDQCTPKLRFSWAVRKLFLEDGTPVLDMEDLRRWCYTHAKQVRKRQREIESGRLQPEMDAIRAEMAVQGETPPPPPQTSQHSEAASSPEKPNTQDELNPRLRQQYFVIGHNFTAPTAYTLCICLYSLHFLDEILPQAHLAAGDTQLMVQYEMFGLSLVTETFKNEETFEGERREVILKSELPILRRFFTEKFRLLKFNLVRMPEETVLATCYVPLDTLVREEHEEFINSTKVAADYALYKKSAEKPKGERTHASMHVEVSITVSIDVDVDNKDEDDEEADAKEAGEEQGNDVVESGAQVEESAGGVASQNESSEAPEELDLENLCIELWASTGEAFVPLRVAHQDFREMMQQGKELRNVLTSKEADKHILKMMQGRRLQAQEPGTFRSTTDPQNPVAVEGGWQMPKGEEVMVEREINDLQDKEAKIRAKHAAKPAGSRQVVFDFDRQLYRQSSMLRLRVFPNGEDPKTATTVWAETVHQALDNASARLGLRKPAKILFDINGKDVHDFGQLSRDQLLCVSSGEPYQRPGAAQENVEIKANWGRAKRMYGPKSTNFQVQARGHPLVGVDPFGPPIHGASRSQQLPQLPSFDTKRVRVFENGRAMGEPESAWGDSLEALLRAATKNLKLRSPAVCFYNEEGHRVVSFNEISRDDLLFASTSNKGFIRR